MRLKNKDLIFETMDENLKCGKGLHDGSCCCNCKFLIKLHKHPWNTQFKGASYEFSGLFACVVENELETNRHGVIFEFEHSVCELHTPIILTKS